MPIVEVPSQGPSPARIMIVGEAPGQNEVESLQPFIGPSGLEMTRMLREAGFDRSECRVTNICRVQPPGNDIERFFGTKTSGLPSIMGRFCRPEIVSGLRLLEEEVLSCNPDLIIAFGNTALWALTGESGIGKWRGSVLECRRFSGHVQQGQQPKVIPTFHPAAVLRQWPLRYIVVEDLRRAKRELDLHGREIKTPAYNFSIQPSYEVVLGKLSELRQVVNNRQLWLSCDIETQRRHIDCIGLAWSSLEAICIPFIQMDTPADRRFYWSPEEQTEIIYQLRELLTHPNCMVIGQNFPYDQQYIAKWWGFIPNLAWDTQTIFHSIFSVMRTGLDFQSSLLCDFHRYWKEDAKDEEGYRLGDLDQWTYNARDCVVTFECKEKQELLLSQLGFKTAAGQTPQQRQMSLHKPFLKAMLRGVRTTKESKQTVYEEIDKSILEHEKYLEDVVGHPLNPRSPQQLARFFYDDMRQRPVINRKTKARTCNEEALITIAKRNPLLAPICEVINDIRSLGTYRAFADAPLDSDYRFRCSYKIPGTTTYRLASKSDAFGFGTNLQNVSAGSRGDEDAMANEIKRGMAISLLQKPNMKKLFLPDPGYTLVEFDLPQADARVVAWDADDDTLKAIFKDPTRDIHTENAIAAFGECHGKSDPRRYFAKEAVHAVDYLVKARTLAATLKCSIQQAEEFIHIWLDVKHPKIRTWHNRVFHEITTRKYVENIFGYRRYALDRVEEDHKDSVAWIGQSTVAIATNTGIVRVDEDLSTKGVDFLLQVHDSAVFQIWTKDGPALAKAILERMIVEIPYPDPLVMIPEAKFSEVSWGDCEEREEWLQ